MHSIAEIIYKTALADGMPEALAKLLVGQSYHETGGWKHKFAMDFNSLFGYSYVKGSKFQIPGGTNADNGVPIARYLTKEDSVHEMTAWIKRRVKEGRFPNLGTITTPLQYATLLQACGYFQGWKKYTKEQNLKFYADGIERGLKII